MKGTVEETLLSRVGCVYNMYDINMKEMMMNIQSLGGRMKSALGKSAYGTILSVSSKEGFFDTMKDVMMLKIKQASIK